MERKQQSAYEATMDIVNKIESGFYGDNNMFDEDVLFDDFKSLYKDLLTYNN